MDIAYLLDRMSQCCPVACVVSISASDLDDSNTFYFNWEYEKANGQKRQYRKAFLTRDISCDSIIEKRLIKVKTDIEKDLE